MKVLGIGFLSESSVSLIENGKIKYAISQERLNRIKNWWGNPFKAIDFVLKETKNNLGDIDFISTHGKSALTKDIPSKEHFKKKILEVENSKLSKKKKKKQISALKKRFNHELKANKRVLGNINSLKKKFKKVEVHDHHDAHAASAYYFSGWQKCYILTIDGWGDNSSSKFFFANKGNMRELTRTHTIDSLGYFYGSITKLLGYKPHRHEGKILGLAAYGNFKKAYSVISKMISYDKLSKSFKGNFEKGVYLSNYKNTNLKPLKKKFSPKDIAAAAQYRIEEVIIEFLKDNLPRGSKLALAGGVFANVKINQKISELKAVEDIFVFPNMGDGGLSTGCAALTFYKYSKYKPINLESMYLGPKYTNKEVLKEIKRSKLNFIKLKKPEKYIAQKLHEGKVVGCFQGRMEFGPRALGNRSILVSTTDNSVNDWLNKKLKRTEFMPFAPITLEKYADEVYKKLSKKRIAVKYMTVTTDCKKKTIKASPAGVHIDGTARPQIISKKTNLKIHNLLSEYYQISKIPSLINTSFNVHEEPIVCTPSDAIRAFKSSKLDYLYIEDYIVHK